MFLLFSNHDFSTVCPAHALLTSAYCRYIVLLLLMIETQRRPELACQVVFLTCFSLQWFFFPISVSDKFWAQSLWTHEHTHTQEKYIILFSCRSHEKIFSPKEQVRSSLSNDAIVSKQINLLWKSQGPAALSSEGISFVYWVVLLPDWCTNRGSANGSWHLSDLQKKKRKFHCGVSWWGRQRWILIPCPRSIAF